LLGDQPGDPLVQESVLDRLPLTHAAIRGHRSNVLLDGTADSPRDNGHCGDAERFQCDHGLPDGSSDGGGRSQHVIVDEDSDAQGFDLHLFGGTQFLRSAVD